MLRKYKPFLKAGAMNAFAYKSAIFTWLFISILQILCVVFLWVAVYQNSPDGMDSIINGFTFKEMIVYTVFVNIFGFATLGGDTLFIINEDIKKGTIDLAFTKPISYRLRLLSENLGNLFAVNLMIGIPGFVIAFIVFASIGFISFTPVSLFISIALFILAQFIANLLNDTISYICGVLCFYTSSGWGINQAKEVIVSFLCGRLLPLAFFPGIFGTIIGYLPFAGISYYPVLILIGKVDVLKSIHYVGFSLCWLILLNIFAKLLFNHASKKITVQGG